MSRANLIALMLCAFMVFVFLMTWLLLAYFHPVPCHPIGSLGNC